MIVGIVLYAVALEEAFDHPDEPLEGAVAGVFIAATALYLLSMAAATFRTYREILYERVAGVAVIAAVVLGWSTGSAQWVVLLSTIVLVATMAVEYLRFRSRIRGTAPTAEPEPVT